MRREFRVCFPALGIHRADSVLFDILPYPKDLLLSSHTKRSSPMCQTPYWELAISLASGPFLFTRCCHCFAMSLEYSPRPSLAPPPCSLFSRRGAVHYFPSFGPNLRPYLPLTSLKNSVWFALSTGGGDDGHQVNPWVTMSRTGMLQTYCGPLESFCVFQIL